MQLHHISSGMLKQSPCRSYRSQGIRVKHVLQFCFLLACCLWLIHQVKPCHDEKEALKENEGKISPKTDGHNEVLKLGRKDLGPQSEETRIGNAKHENDEEEAEGIEEEEEEEEEEGSEPGEEEDRGGGDDEIDELHQEREFEGEENFVDVEEDREVEDQEAGEKYSEDKERQNDNRISVEEAIAGEKGEIFENIVSQNSPLLSPDVAVEPNGQLEVGNNTTSENTNLEAISLGHENNSKVASNSNQIDSILMIHGNTEKAEEPRGESSNSSATVPRKVTASNATSLGSSEPIKDVDNSPEIRSQGNNRGVAAE